MTFEKKWSLAETLFPGPGDYALVLRQRKLTSELSMSA